MNEALKETIRTGMAHYYSRQAKLARETSGHYQRSGASVSTATATPC